MAEEWRSIRGFEGLYEVSDQGMVRSLDRYVNAKSGSFTKIKGVTMKPQKNHKGYMAVVLHKDGKPFTKFVHRLVAEAFIENKENLPQVNHKDTNKTNNAVVNLEWISNYDNMKHAIEHGCYKNAFTTKTKEAVLGNLKIAIEKRKTPVIQMTLKGEVIRIYESVKEAEKNTGFSSSKICAVCRGRRKTTGGYMWKYGGKTNE